METKWLEDFICLAENRSFSRSAQIRHVTQPAFSRRIQALETWAGVNLVDRSSYPTRLTSAGEVLYAQSIDLLQNLQSMRSLLHQYGQPQADVLDFAVPHSLALAFFPNWMHQIQAHLGPMRTRLTALNVHDAVMRLAEGTCDLLVAFHHDAHPIQLDAQRYEMLVLGQETIAPYVKPDEQGRPTHTLPGTVDSPVPYLGYGQGAYLGHIVATLIKQMPMPLYLNKVYETDMAESLKAMALQGHGIAFLPLSAVQAELNASKLVAAVDANSPHSIELSFDIRLYREKPSRQDESKRSAQLLWDCLLAHDAARTMHFSHNAV